MCPSAAAHDGNGVLSKQPSGMGADCPYCSVGTLNQVAQTGFCRSAVKARQAIMPAGVLVMQDMNETTSFGTELAKLMI